AAAAQHGERNRPRRGDRARPRTGFVRAAGPGLRAAGFDTQARRQAINGLAMRIGGIADCLANLRGWRRSLPATGFGGLARLSAPPFYLVQLLWIAFPGYYWMLGAARSGGAAFLTGWTFGLGFFAPGLYWVSWALTVDLSRFFWLMPVAIVGL